MKFYISLAFKDIHEKFKMTENGLYKLVLLKLNVKKINEYGTQSVLYIL